MTRAVLRIGFLACLAGCTSGAVEHVSYTPSNGNTATDVQAGIDQTAARVV